MDRSLSSCSYIYGFSASCVSSRIGDGRTQGITGFSVLLHEVYSELIIRDIALHWNGIGIIGRWIRVDVLFQIMVF